MSYIAIITGKYVGPCIDCDKISFSVNRRKIYEKISKKYIFQKKSPTRREIPELWGNNLWLIPLQVLKGFHYLY